MIHEVTGDILFSKAALIAHGVAPGDDFHTGLALALRERFPSLYKDFRHHFKTAHPQAGGIWTWSGVGPHGAVRIANLLTQEPPAAAGGRPGRARLEHVNHSLKALRHVIESERVPSVALPRIATGVGGLDWKDVAPLVRKHLADAGIPVIVYTTYAKGVAADEPVTAVARS